MAKQPQDHKQKAEKPKVVDATVKVGDRETEGWEITHRGFTVRIPREAFDDFELLDEMAAIQDMKPPRLPSLLRRLVGDDFKVAMDGLRDDATGRVQIASATEYMLEIMQAVNPNG